MINEPNEPSRLTGWKKRMAFGNKNVCFIPQRYMLATMGFFAILNAYSLRTCVSVAIVDMSNYIKPEVNATDRCVYDHIKTKSKSKRILSKQFDWNGDLQGQILSSFYWGYFLTHLPAGIIAEMFGGKHCLGGGLLLAGITTLLTPIVTLKFDWIGLWVLRFILGLAQGPSFPALNVLLAHWVPAEERSILGTVAFSGMQIGTILGNALSGVLIHETQRWESVFYFFGSATILWFIIWMFVCFSSPETHPFIKDKEYNFLKERIDFEKKVTSCKQIPWKGILTNVPIWALLAVQIGCDWGTYTILTYLPTYMKEILQYSIKDNGLLSSLPHVFTWVIALLSGYLCNWLINKRKLSVGLARKIFTTIAQIGPAIFIVSAAYSKCGDRVGAVVNFCIALLLKGTFFPGMKINSLDLTTNYSGTVMAITNGIGAIAGALIPIIIGKITTNHSLTEWKRVFWINFVIMVSTCFIFIIFGSGREQEFNKPEYVYPGCCREWRERRRNEN